MFEILKEAAKYYSQLKHDENQKRRLLKKNLDYEYLQQLIDKVENHNVMISIETADHAHLEIKPLREHKNGPIFSGD